MSADLRDELDAVERDLANRDRSRRALVNHIPDRFWVQWCPVKRELGAASTIRAQVDSPHRLCPMCSTGHRILVIESTPALAQGDGL